MQKLIVLSCLFIISTGFHAWGQNPSAIKVQVVFAEDVPDLFQSSFLSQVRSINGVSVTDLEPDVKVSILAKQVGDNWVISTSDSLPSAVNPLDVSDAMKKIGATYDQIRKVQNSLAWSRFDVVGYHGLTIGPLDDAIKETVAAIDVHELQPIRTENDANMKLNSILEQGKKQ